MATFRIVPERSKVWTETRSTLHPIEGEAAGIQGSVEIELSDHRPDLTTAPAAHIELPIGQLRSGNALYDSEMQRRVDARRYPTIVGDLMEATEAGGGRYRLVGGLTFHGVTRPVELEAYVKIHDGSLQADWEQTVDIRDFGLSPPKILMFRVQPDVKVRVHLEAEREAMG